jgi:capsule polysaccharide modification protein KpsS
MRISIIPQRQLENEIEAINNLGYTVEKSEILDDISIKIFYRESSQMLLTSIQEEEPAFIQDKRKRSKIESIKASKIFLKIKSFSWKS